MGHVHMDFQTTFSQTSCPYSPYSFPFPLNPYPIPPPQFQPPGGTSPWYHGDGSFAPWLLSPVHHRYCPATHYHQVYHTYMHIHAHTIKSNHTHTSTSTSTRKHKNNDDNNITSPLVTIIIHHHHAPSPSPSTIPITIIRGSIVGTRQDMHEAIAFVTRYYFDSQPCYI